MTAMPSLAIIAGGGALPRLVAENARAQGFSIYIVRLKNDADEIFPGFDGIVSKPEKLGFIFSALRRRNIRDLVLIGRMKRPVLSSLRPDRTTLTLLPRLLPALIWRGDDTLLKSVRKMLEGQGFHLHAAQEFVGNLLAPDGQIGKCTPSAEQLNDIRIGIEAARQLGRRDRGQAVLIKNGAVRALESAQGTDMMISRYAVQGSVLVKMAKPQQDRALDLPSIGPETVRACIAGGVSGIAIETGSTLMVDKDQIIQLADQNGLFVIGVT